MISPLKHSQLLLLLEPRIAGVRDMSQRHRREELCEDPHLILVLQTHPNPQHLRTPLLPFAVAAGQHSFPGPDALTPVLLGPGSAQPDCPVQLGAPGETGCNQTLEGHNSAHSLTDYPVQRPRKL